MREVGWKIVFDILKSVYTLYFIFGVALFWGGFYSLNQYLVHLIR